MRAYAYDQVLVNPDVPAVIRRLVEASSFANYRCRVRTVHVGDISRNVRIWSGIDGRMPSAGDQPGLPDGPPCHLWQDGGGACSHLGHRARTSVAGLAWFYDRVGNLHVRVVGGRVKAPRSGDGMQRPDPFGLRKSQLEETHPAALVYRELWIPPVHDKHRGVNAEAARSVVADPTEVVNWMAMLDRLIDKEDDTLAGLKHRFELGLERARSLARLAEETRRDG